MKKTIVTTTISPPTEATEKFLQKKDWNMIIVGDLKTPHDIYRKLEKEYPQLTYMSPEDQENKYKALSDAIGWNKIMRRNLGFVEAYAAGAEIVASIDDDNIPYDNWGKNIYVGQEVEVDMYDSDNGVFDPLSVTSAKYLWHRGYPAELIPTRLNIVYSGKTRRRVLVQADLWDGVPDIDAIGRIVYAPRIKIETAHPFCGKCIAPFNSQNTFVAREVLPYYMVIPHIGRMDDIWGAYLVQKKFPDSLIFGGATVYQDRYEPHQRNIKDIGDEMLGYENTLKFIRGEFQLPENALKAYMEYQACF